MHTTAAPAQIIAKATAPHVVTYTDRLSGISCELFHNPAYGSFYVVRWNANDKSGPAFTTRAAALDALQRELRGAAFFALVAAA